MLGHHKNRQCLYLWPMRMHTHNLKLYTVKIFLAISYCTVSLHATVSADRLNLYKDIGLIEPGKVEHQVDVSLFYNPDTKQWTKGGKIAGLIDKYASMTLEDWLKFDWTSEDAQEAAGYLSGVINDEIKSNLANEDAKDALLNGFNKDFNGFFPIRGIERECEYLSSQREWKDGELQWKDVKGDFSPNSYTGMLWGLHTPKIDFNKAEILYDIYNFSADRYINLTPEQILKLNCNECEFVGLNLTQDFILKAIMVNCDLSRCQFNDEMAKKTALYFKTLDSGDGNTYPSLEGASINSAAEFMEIYKKDEASIIFIAQRPTVPQEWVSFNGTEDFTGAKFNNAKIGNWTGVTAEQILSANPNFQGTTLPAIRFDGTEDISKFNLKNGNITNTTGLTASQIASIPSSNLENIWLTASQYNDFKEVLKEKNIKRVVVDGKYITP